MLDKAPRLMPPKWDSEDGIRSVSGTYSDGGLQRIRGLDAPITVTNIIGVIGKVSTSCSIQRLGPHHAQPATLATSELLAIIKTN